MNEIVIKIQRRKIDSQLSCEMLRNTCRADSHSRRSLSNQGTVILNGVVNIIIWPIRREEWRLTCFFDKQCSVVGY